MLRVASLSVLTHTHSRCNWANQRVDLKPHVAVYEKVQPRAPSSKQVKPELHMQSPSLSGPVLVADGQTDGGGAGVGPTVGVGGAPPSPTYKSALVSPALRPERASITALFSNSCKTAELFMLGFASKTSAAPPETWGHAIEVPLKVAVQESQVCPAESTLLPGAQMSVHAP